MAITAQMIKELRDRTGVGMSKCKEALEEAKGDLDLAIKNLRKAGMASAVKKEGRTANEGVIGIGENGNCIAIVEVNAETDFVVRNDKFQAFLKAVADEVAKTAPASLEDFLKQPYSGDSSLTIDEYRATIVQAIGENVQIRRLMTLTKTPEKSVGVYSHMGGKMVTSVELSGSADEESLAKSIAMHVAAAAPEHLSPDSVPAEVLAHEKEIAKGQIKNKPENIIDKIIEGKLRAYFDENCLTKQKYIKNDKQTVEELVGERAKETGKPLSISGFSRWCVGQ